uniref:GDP-mannose 4,6 dehydratase n=1 Tax=Marseillevirus LCMAC201 TaxID=2506605 RepID=A0A481YWF6_9VIRU|nr:MAG: GDP-mannose 4,6 dehydratase [Marseillevirus LCMAC201]
MNLLITGGYGFIGSNFINYYFKQNLSVHIVNIDAMYYCAKKTNVDQNIRDNLRYTSVKGNIQSMDLVKHILVTHKITHVIHFAAQSHVQNSFEESLQYTQDNILGTHVLLEACRQWGKLERFIHVSTDEVYGESMIDSERKMHEGSVLCPTNPYAATKAGAELIAMSYYHSFGMPIIISRGNNVYGPNQYPEKLIPCFIEMLKADQPVTIQGDGSCVRSFLHVYDVVRAFELILHKGTIGEIYNIGGDDSHEYSVMEITKRLIRMIKNTEELQKWVTHIADRPFNDKRYYINNEKLKRLGWKIEYDLESGLKTII